MYRFVIDNVSLAANGRRRPGEDRLAVEWSAELSLPDFAIELTSVKIAPTQGDDLGKLDVQPPALESAIDQQDVGAKTPTSG
jgi:hypothetical protein